MKLLTITYRDSRDDRVIECRAVISRLELDMATARPLLLDARVVNLIAAVDQAWEMDGSEGPAVGA